MLADDEARLLRAQRDALAADERLRRRARADAELSVEERLAVAARLARQAYAFLDNLPAPARERALAYREPLDAAALEGLLRRSRLTDP